MKKALYNSLIFLSQLFIWPTQFFSKKMKLFVSGRRGVFNTLQKHFTASDTVVWFHCASLGEFEQGVPIMQAIKEKHPSYKLLVTFFSPSGYEVKKNFPLATVVTYLPMDTKPNVKKFIATARPSIAFFVKYEFWPNYLFELKKNKIPTFLISGLFRKEQLFFRSKESFMKEVLECFEHFFVQDIASQKLLSSIGINRSTANGDTRFDRVSKQIEIDNHVPFLEEFIAGATCIVCGSTWPEDEAIILPFLNQEENKNVKFIIAPHKIEISKIKSLQEHILGKSVLYSEINESSLTAQVLIIDSVGKLTKIYSYGDIAYVGGAMGNTGLHNILEPATFGVPIVIGKNYSKFPEAVKLEDLAGLYSISTAKKCSALFHKLIKDGKFRSQTGMIAEHYINSNTGATAEVMEYLNRNSLI